MRGSERVSQILPTSGIGDPEVRAVVESIARVVHERSGYPNKDSPDRFITKGEFPGMASDAIMRAFSPGVGAGGGDATGGSAVGGAGSAGSVIDALAQSIMNSILFQKINENFKSIDVGAIRDEIVQKFGSLQTGIYQEAEARSEADQQVTNTLTAQISSLSTTLNAAIATEGSTRVTKDNALAQAINTIWAQVGGNTAVIQDNALATAGTNSAQATKFTQVQAAVTDPNTGTVYTAASKATFESYANSADSTLNAIYTLRVQLQAGGTSRTATAAAASASSGTKGQTKVTLTNQSGAITTGMYAYGPGIPGGATVTLVSGSTVTLSSPLNANVSTADGAYTFSTQRPVVGGFGIAATQGAGSGQSPTIDFGITADRFWIAAPTGAYDAASANSSNDGFPFIVLTTPTVINGVTIPPGVYMKKVSIADASIDTAKIAYNIRSNNFNGTLDATGAITSVGTTGWAIDKSGFAVFQNIYARGNIQASSLTAGVVNTDHIVGNAVTKFDHHVLTPSLPGQVMTAGYTVPVGGDNNGKIQVRSLGGGFFIDTEGVAQWDVVTFTISGPSGTVTRTGLSGMTEVNLYAPTAGNYTVTVQYIAYTGNPLDVEITLVKR